MKKSYRITALIITVFMAFSMLVSCAKKPENENPVNTPESTQTAEAPKTEETADPEQTKTGTHKVIDNKGNEVEVSDDIEKVAIISSVPLASVYCMLAKENTKLVGLTKASKNAAVNSFLTRIVDGLDEISTDFSKDGNVNVEEVLKLEPDVVFYNLNNAGDTEAASKLTDMGIACVGFTTTIGNFSTIGTFNEWAKLISAVLGKESDADEIVKYGNDVEAMVKERVAEIPESERTSAVMLNNYANNDITVGGGTFAKYWLETIGAINPITDIGTPTAQINLEQLYEWNPEVIFLNSFSAYTAGDIINSTAGEGQDFSGIKAIQDKRVYKMPLGMYYWFPPCSDSPLALLWLAKTLYPESFADIDMDATIKDYYKNFYGIELSEEDLNTLYNPPKESAWK